MRERDRERDVSDALAELSEQSAYKWLTSNDAFRESLDSLRKSANIENGGEIEFMAMIAFYLIQARAALGRGKLPEPTKDERDRARRAAHELRALVRNRGAGFIDRPANSGLVSLLTKFIEDQETLAKQRKARHDATAIGRQFVTRLAESIIRRYGECPPSVVKPLASWVNHDWCERGYARLVAKARNLIAQEKEQVDNSRRVAHEALRRATERADK